jgi:hypothetical protein
VGIIIVEGPDGAGKTTLLSNLRKDSAVYFWTASSSHRPKTLRELTDAVHWISQATYLKLPVICDRFPILSESVYGILMRGKCLLDELSPRHQQQITESFRDGVDRIIYCRPPLEQIKHNVKGIPQMEGVVEVIERIVQRYDELMRMLKDEDKLHVTWYDYTKPIIRTENHYLHNLFFGEYRDEQIG